jgi:Mrp family chromosome partitioning ATPase
MDEATWVEGSGRKLLAALLGGWPLVAVAALGLAASAYLYAKAQPPTYQASGRVFLSADALGGASGQDLVRFVSTQADLASSSPVLARIGERLGLPVETVLGRLTVSPAEEGNYFTIEGAGETPNEAVELVKSAERAYQELVSAQQQRNRQAILESLVDERTTRARELEEARARLAQTPEDPRLQAQVEILTEQLRALRARQGDALIDQPGGNLVQLAETPQPPTAPAAPKPLWNGVVGGLLGGIIGVAFVWWRSERFAVSNQPAIAADELGVALLGRVGPERRRHPDLLDATRADPDLAQLALAIELAGRRQLGHNLSVLALMYSDPTASISTTTLGLASALASGGRQVLLADGMQHQPLIGTLTAQGLLSPKQHDPPAPLPLPTSGTKPDVLVLSLGLDGRPGQIATAHTALDDAQRAGKLVVLLAAAPNTPQAALLVSACEAVVLVARPRTRLAALTNTKARLDDLDRPVLGLIFEKSRRLRWGMRRQRRRASQSSRGVATPSWADRRALDLSPRHPGPTPAPDGGSNGGRSRTRESDLGVAQVEHDHSGIIGATPRGWREHIEPRFDLRIAVPAEWRPIESREGTVVLYDPQTDSVASVEGADQGELSSGHPLWDYDEDQYEGYKRIKLESTMFKGLPALDWEFAHSENGTRLRVTDLRLFIGDFVYRMSFQSPETVWPELRATLFGIRDSFSIGVTKSS